jgi:hypothetical protein
MRWVASNSNTTSSAGGGEEDDAKTKAMSGPVETLVTDTDGNATADTASSTQTDSIWSTKVYSAKFLASPSTVVLMVFESI